MTPEALPPKWSHFFGLTKIALDRPGQKKADEVKTEPKHKNEEVRLSYQMVAPWRLKGKLIREAENHFLNLGFFPEIRVERQGKDATYEFKIDVPFRLSGDIESQIDLWWAAFKAKISRL